MDLEKEISESARRVRAETDRVSPPVLPAARRRVSGPAAFAIGALAVMLVVGVGAFIFGLSTDGSPVGSGDTTIPPDAGDVVYQGSVTVIDTGGNPVICSGGVAESYPPQCGGPSLAGLDWAMVPWAESANGVTWASMSLTVSYDGEKFELVGSPDEVSSWPEGDEIDFTPPCDAPDGGWVWTDGPMTTPEHMDAAITYANSQPDLSAIWVYNLMEDLEQADEEGRQEYVVVALFTGDLERHETAMRDLWGGPLCVAEGGSESAELLSLQEEITGLATAGSIPGLVGFGYSYPDDIKGQVVIGALIASPEASAWSVDNYGEGVVRFEATLVPVTD